MQLEIRNAVERDRLMYNAAGFIAGCLIAILFFRRVSFMIVAAGPLAAILFALGALGWLDLRLNIFLNVMTPLIMVSLFSDPMQLTFAARDRLDRGQGQVPAPSASRCWWWGPACVLTHATAGISFAALLFSDSELIRTFGEAGLAATLVALIAVLTLVPAARRRARAPRGGFRARRANRISASMRSGASVTPSPRA